MLNEYLENVEQIFVKRLNKVFRKMLIMYKKMLNNYLKNVKHVHKNVEQVF